MKRVAILMLMLLAFLAPSICSAQLTAQTNVLYGNVSSFGLAGRTNLEMTLSIIYPKNRMINNVFISNDPITSYSDTNGNFSFTNVAWGYYNLSAADSWGTHWPILVFVNTFGSNSLMSLLNYLSAIPPNNQTNYYTIAQINAMLASIGYLTNYATTTNFGVVQLDGVTIVETNGVISAIGGGGGGGGGISNIIFPTNSPNVYWTNTSVPQESWSTNATFTSLNIGNPAPGEESKFFISNTSSSAITNNLAQSTYSLSGATNSSAFYIAPLSTLLLDFNCTSNGTIVVADFGPNPPILAQLAQGNAQSLTNYPLATSTTPGIAKPDNLTITVSGGVYTVIGGGGGGTTSNAFILNSNNVATGQNTFTGGTNFFQGIVATNLMGPTNQAFTGSFLQSPDGTPSNLVFTANGNSLTNLNAAKITGTIPISNLPANVVTNIPAVANSTNFLGTLQNGNEVAIPYSLLPAGGGGGSNGVTSVSFNTYNGMTNQATVVGSQLVVYLGQTNMAALNVYNVFTTSNSFQAVYATGYYGNGSGIFGIIGTNIAGIGGNNYLFGPDGNATISGTHNEGFGFNVLSALTSGSYNTEGGEGGLNANTSGQGNTGLGYLNLNNNVSGNNNQAAGVQSLYENTTGTGNSANGADALFNNMQGSFNTAMGENALVNNVSGSNNIALGFGAGSAIGGSSNIDIGNPGLATDTNVIRIGSTQTSNVIAGVIYGNAGGMTNYQDIIDGPTTRTIEVAGGSNAKIVIDATSGERLYDSAGNLQLTVNPNGVTAANNLFASGNFFEAATGSNNFSATNTMPGLVVTNNAIVGGNVNAGSFTGNGSGLTSLNASSLASGTVPIAQLPLATSSTVGVVKPDNSSISVNGSGQLSVIGGTVTSVNVFSTNNITNQVSFAGGVVTISLGLTNQIKFLNGPSPNSVAVSPEGTNGEWTNSLYLSFLQSTNGANFLAGINAAGITNVGFFTNQGNIGNSGNVVIGGVETAYGTINGYSGFLDNSSSGIQEDGSGSFVAVGSGGFNAAGGGNIRITGNGEFIGKADGLTNLMDTNIVSKIASNGQVLTYDNALGIYQPSNSAAGGSGFPLTANGNLAGYSLTNGSFVGNGGGLTNLNGNAFAGPVAAVDVSGPFSVNGDATTIGPSTSFALGNTNYGGHGEVQLIGNVFNYQAPDASNAFDGSVITSAADNTGAIIGLQVTNAQSVVPTRWRWAPQPSTPAGGIKEWYMNGVQLFECTDTSFDSRTIIDTTPISFAYPTLFWSPRYQFRERTLTNAPSSVYFCWNFTNSALGVAELQIFAIGTTNGQPAAPVISPWGGHFTNNTVTVTLSDISTAASIYWTTNGWVGSNLYTGPFNLTPLGSVQQTPINFQAVAYDAGLIKPFGQVSSNAFFYSTGMVPLDDLRDQQGNLIEAHGGCILNDTQNGHGFLWYGDFCNQGQDATSIFDSAGVWCYQSSDLLNWVNLGQVVAVPQIGASYYEYRPKVLFNQQYNNYVLWNNLGTGAGSSTYGVAVSTNGPSGPFNYVNTNAQPFGATTGYGDFNLYEAPNGIAYIVSHTNAPSGGTWIRQLDGTYTNWTSASPVQVTSQGFEAPILFANPNGGFNCIESGGNFYNSTATYQQTNFYCPRTTPMGTWYPNATPVFAQDPLNLPGASPTNFYNAQSAFVFPSPWNTNQVIYAADHWYNGSTPWWNILSQSYSTNVTLNTADGTNGTLYNSRQVWLPLSFTATGFSPLTNAIATTNANWALQEWNKFWGPVGTFPIQGSNAYLQGTVTAQNVNAANVNATNLINWVSGNTPSNAFVMLDYTGTNVEAVTQPSLTNLLSLTTQSVLVEGTQYVNQSNAPIALTVSFKYTDAAVAGYCGMSLNIVGSITNYSVVPTTTGAVAGTGTNFIQGIIPGGDTYYITNQYSGSGNSATIITTATTVL
jgi:hypothetical protein